MRPIFVTDCTKVWTDQLAPQRELKDLEKDELIRLIEYLYVDLGRAKDEKDRINTILDNLIASMKR